MKDNMWNMKANKAKAIMLAGRQLAEFVCDAVNLEGLNFDGLVKSRKLRDFQ